MARYGRRGRYDSYERFGYGGFAPYVPVATRRANAAKHAEKLAKKRGRELAPVKIATRAIATTYWGKAWCENLEAYSDFANRLPRGRTYARNGSIVDLQIAQGEVTAIVGGSDIYNIKIKIATLPKPQWERIKADCSRSIGSLIDLLQGKFDAEVMRRLAAPGEGLFPRPKEIAMNCSCPDSASLCKHLAAVLYAVGHRLDAEPEMLFTLRKVDHLELVNQAVSSSNLDSVLGTDSSAAGELATSDLGDIFGIELEQAAAPKKKPRAKKAAAIAHEATTAVAVVERTRRKSSTKTTAATEAKCAPKSRRRSAR